MYVVPKGVWHKPFAKNKAKMLLIEPSGVQNTGDNPIGALSAKNDVCI